MRAFHRTVSTWHFLSLLVAIVIAALHPLAALSATCTVNSASDDTQDATAKVVTVDSAGWAGANKAVITLRDCIVAANLMTGTFGEPTSPGMDIDLHAIAGQTIVLEDALPLIFNNLSIDAGNAAAVTVSGNDAHRIFFVSGLPALANGNVEAHALLPTDNDDARPISVSLRGLIVAHGLAKGGSSNGGGGGMGAGGGLFVNKNASVSLTDVSFDSNRAIGGDSANNQPAASGGGGMGAGSGGAGGGGLGAPSDNTGNGGGVGGDGGSGSVSGFGGFGMGQISAAQGFDRFQFGVAYGCCNNGSRIGEGGSALRESGGGFGGGGSSPTLLSTSDGGFGGGGGSNFSGAGGFGGGGAHSGGMARGGNGGFGGGGGEGNFFNGQGGRPGSGGIGGVTGSDLSQGGGAGAGFGGAVFVRAGGSLVIQGTSTSSIADNTTAGGTGYLTAAAAGAGMFTMSGANTTFDIDGVATIADNIDDESNIVLPSGQSYTQGCLAGGDPACGATISKVGNGTLVVNGRVYAIKISIDAGTIEANGELGYKDVLVNAGGRLSGTGIATKVTLGAAGILSPGHVTTSGAGGTLNPFGVKWHTQGIAEFRLTSAQATSSTMTVYSMESIPGDDGLRPIRALIGASTPMIGGTYNLVHCTHSCVGSTNFELALSDFALDPASTVRGTLGLSASNLTLTVTQVIGDRIFYSGLEY